jgi:chlorophyll/bacteriochlorophyll a synthase
MDTPPLAHTPHTSRPQRRGCPESARLRTVAEFLKPITWFPPMWAFACGVVASGQDMSAQLGFAALGFGADRTAGVRQQPGGERLV